MAFKINIAEKEKTWKIESESEELIGKKLGETIQGKDISDDLAGYDLKINGASDIAGFPHKEDVEGPQLKRVLLTKGWGMHKRPKKEGKKKVSTPKGFRMRKTVRGKVISDKTVQINLIIVKPGNKTLASIFPEQNKKEEAPVEKPAEEATPAKEAIESTEAVAEEIKKEIKEEVKEEIKENIPESNETKTGDSKEKVAEEVAEEVIEESKKVAEKIAKEEKKE